MERGARPPSLRLSFSPLLTLAGDSREPRRGDGLRQLAYSPLPRYTSCVIMAEQNRNLWAPWRMEYIHSLHEEGEPKGCFLCRYAETPGEDSRHHVIWRGEHCFTLFNAFPYSNGHLLIAPYAHQGRLDGLDDATLTELMRQLRDAQKLLTETTSAQGFNAGMNFGRCAGAGLPDHLHIHIVPRWDGDTNFMPVLGNVKVIPQSIDALMGLMREAAPRLGLPPVRG
jgi:ATP adenylyltransferase